jgi:hypothetical protein
MQTKTNGRMSSITEIQALLGASILSQSLAPTSIYDTLHNPKTDTIWLNPHFKYAQSFTTGSSSCMLNSITIGMMGGIGKTSGGFFISIYDATSLSGGPGYPVSSPLTGPDDPSYGPNEYIGELEMKANTTYWVVAIVAQDGGTYGWNTGDEASIGCDIGYSENFILEEKWSKPDSSSRLQMKVNIIQSVSVPEYDPFPEFGMQMSIAVG